jgi:hypothetical protein
VFRGDSTIIKPINKFGLGDFKVLLMDTPNVMEIKENGMKFSGMFKNQKQLGK